MVKLRVHSCISSQPISSQIWHSLRAWVLQDPPFRLPSPVLPHSARLFFIASNPWQIGHPSGDPRTTKLGLLLLPRPLGCLLLPSNMARPCILSSLLFLCHQKRGPLLLSALHSLPCLGCLAPVRPPMLPSEPTCLTLVALLAPNTLPPARKDISSEILGDRKISYNCGRLQ